MRKVGRPKTGIKPSQVRKLRGHSDRLTWEQIAIRLGISVSTAQKLWKQ
jgi:DNA-binding transcriptional regulator YiaG